ncbi:phosphatidylinositol 4,5-bisphosphate 3-kinase catalytic subunit gamma isoform [Micropterus dolomieu]|uniref:phosphatidylinositol 4,5-bisphosphate 3-kinase catalytic subunit gamma isoform n=1 Tax=Micropterus dolomieu TaxID=147949 RepID=UPI001E8EB1E6|nr:phosphatidylinositol 4,5-bisphosphate 3-kinase catalytic subunit gamma isoform [Micropterus dolomieu]XP_045912999.1 phosphatidylinositol 4,5-bisphosphate 3-kinase catalytic subunit gamma isoform [Micropterus dolomieu]
MDPPLLLNRTVSSHTVDCPPEMLIQSCSDNNLKFICEFKPGPGLPEVSGDEDYNVNMDCKSVSVILPAQCSVYQLRLRICIQAQEQNCHPDPLAILDPEKYTLLYFRGKDWFEAYDDCQVIRTLDIPWSCDDTGRLLAHIVVQPLVAVDSEEIKKQQQCLAYLIGHNLEKEASDRLGELTFTRRKLASPRRQELRNRDNMLYATEPWITCAPIPNDLQDQLNRKLTVTMHFMSKISFSIQVDFTTMPNVLLKVFRRVMSDQRLDYDTSESLVLKVSGREEFLSGDYPLSAFLWVRQCLKTNQDLHLSVIPVSQLADETVKFVELPLVDGSSGQFSSHDDLRLEGKDLDDIFMISLLDCNRRLRVKLLGFDIPTLPNKCPQSVYVKASILYGNKVLSSVSSTPKAFADEVLWNEWLDFDVLLRDLPRGAKLGFTINTSGGDISPATKDPTPSVTKESKPPTSSIKVAPDLQKGKGKVLYFVNLLLIDHRSILSQGPYTLHMWPYPDLEEEAITYQADKLSSATNPDIADSMAISFFLDRYSFPVVLPNSFRPSDLSNSPTSSLTQTKSTASSYALSSSPSSPSSPPSTLSSTDNPDLLDSKTDTVTLRSSPDSSSKRAGFTRFREESIQYASNLPHYLRKVDWMNRRAVEDVHWLLGSWDPGELDVTVALELLSMDFADETVRRLAVQRLESLSNDDVLKYLLQLVQTLKVEPYHDSFLALYLIRRALRSKRIGHFFFWYVRSEVAGCPYFRQRMAVILEAYLLGCGQAMLDNFTQQVQAVEALKEVSIVIKNLYKNDLPPTAPLKLQELLRDCYLPNEFLLPFDPRIKVGRILLDKCKVMASKKKPLWLEFCPMPSPTSATPVGIIFKEGDDLRQDMLIIQTLVVMESIWQEKSLDLNLIPYGCISTGYNIGMIEIVRNAVTIAAVQKSHGGTTSAFRNDALFEWLKSKCPLQEIHYKTTERFVKSCAGYCVATYVLGIGDRHNDNIMITDQGNLFHIDFGHILGNRKHFLGVSRERVPFVLTPDFLFVMGRIQRGNSLYFERFRDTCAEAYLSLRSHSRLLITLFSLMLLTGIPELSAAEDMRYLREALQEEQSEAEAKEHFLQQIYECEKKGWTVQANWWIHMVAGIK